MTESSLLHACFVCEYPFSSGFIINCLVVMRKELVPSCVCVSLQFTEDFPICRRLHPRKHYASKCPWEHLVLSTGVFLWLCNKKLMYRDNTMRTSCNHYQCRQCLRWRTYLYFCIGIICGLLLSLYCLPCPSWPQQNRDGRTRKKIKNKPVNTV